jgi:hypothetical protein
VARRQAVRFADKDQAIAANRGAGYAQGYQQAAAPQPASAPAAAPAAEEPSYVAELEGLADLHAKGVLSDEEYDAKKRQILGI